MRGAALACLVAGLLTGCAVNPTSNTDRQERVAQDSGLIDTQQPPITAPVGLYQAMARAVLGNLDQRVKLMEVAVAQGISDAASYELLPQTVANRGWTRRNNDNTSTSKTISTGSVSDASTSEDRSHITSQLAASWNVLDFGISWLKSRQNANRVLIARELRRKARQSLLQDVRVAWGKAVAAEKLTTEIDPLIVRVRTALASAQDIETLRLQSPVQALDYQKQLLEILRQLQSLRRELGGARVELANLMGVPPQRPFALAMPDDSYPLPVVPVNLPALEDQALVDRPELREQDYQARITADETRKALLRLLPGIEFSADVNRDDNSYLTNHTWADIGLKLVWNVVNLASAPATIDLANRQEELTLAKRLSLHMAVLTQVNVAWIRLAMARDDFTLAQSLAEVDGRIYQHTQAAMQSSAQSELELIRAEASRSVSRLRRALAYAEVQAAAAALRVSVGDDPALLDTDDVLTLTQALRHHFQPWDAPREAPARVKWEVLP
ncbi:MAG: TolC family protein [Alphaproteobacteria bacterium]|nr:TolC family protein [Alphaproteobacteria bacterium]